MSEWVTFLERMRILGQDNVVVKCVQCHDPHEGLVQFRRAGEQTTRTTCVNCHFNQKYKSQNCTQL
jgi:predicted CXXCH cytochrome family protein